MSEEGESDTSRASDVETETESSDTQSSFSGSDAPVLLNSDKEKYDHLRGEKRFRNAEVRDGRVDFRAERLSSERRSDPRIFELGRVSIDGNAPQAFLNRMRARSSFDAPRTRQMNDRPFGFSRKSLGEFPFSRKRKSTDIGPFGIEEKAILQKKESSSRIANNRNVFLEVYDGMLQNFRDAFYDFKFKGSSRLDAFQLVSQLLERMKSAGKISSEECGEATASLTRENKDRHYLYLANQIAIPVIEVLCLRRSARLAIARLKNSVNLLARDQLPTRIVVVILTPNPVYSAWVKKSITFIVHVFAKEVDGEPESDVRRLFWSESQSKISADAISEAFARFQVRELERIDKGFLGALDYAKDNEVDSDAVEGGRSSMTASRPSVQWSHRLSKVVWFDGGDVRVDGKDEADRMEAGLGMGLTEGRLSTSAGSANQERISGAIRDLVLDVTQAKGRERNSAKVGSRRESGSSKGSQSVRGEVNARSRSPGVSFRHHKTRDRGGSRDRIFRSHHAGGRDEGSPGSSWSSESSYSSGYADRSVSCSSESSVSFFDEDTGAMHAEMDEKVESELGGQTGPLGLQFSKVPMRGMWEDFKRRFPFYINDWREGFHVKCLSATIFLFFSCLTAAVAFGSLMDIETNSNIGVMEMIVATGAVGILFASFAGQPLIIQGGTGPLLVFTKYLYQITKMMGVDFLPAYAWVGFWTGTMLMAVAVFNLNFLIRYFSPFVDEVFAALISLFFIYEACNDLIHPFLSEGDENIEVPLLGLILGLGVLFVAIKLSGFRYAKFLRPTARSFVSDFGSPIAILSMTLVGILFSHVEVETLHIPSSFSTTSGRGWLIPLQNVPWWFPFFSILPALLSAILCYVDQNISARIINRPQFHLKKGPGYNIDMFLVGAVTIGTSMVGLPWLVAATVRSLNHVSAVSRIEERENAVGKVEPFVVEVYENRLSGVLIHFLVCLSVFASPILKRIPLPALFGLFLFMGIVSLQGNALWERIKLIATQPAFFPKSHYVRNVKFWKICVFTLIQGMCLAVLWGVKSSPIAITFPLVIISLVPVRWLIGKLPFFTKKDLLFLDSDELPLDLSEANLSEVDFSDRDLSGFDLRGANLVGTCLAGSILPRNLQNANLAQVDLSGRDLSAHYLDGTNLSGAILSKCILPESLQNVNLYGADLSGVDLSHSNLSETNLSRAILTNTILPRNLRYVNLSQVDLSGRSFDGVNLSGANLSGARLSGADLSGAVLRGANLTRVDLDNAILPHFLQNVNLSHANLSGANLTDFDLREANLTEANLGRACLFGADLSSAILRDASLPHALQQVNLSRVDLSRRKLTDFDLRGAILSGTNFCRADLSYADLTDATLTHANFSRAILKETILPNQMVHVNLSHVDLSGRNLKGFDFRESHLVGTDFSGADLDGAVFDGADLDNAILSGNS